LKEQNLENEINNDSIINNENQNQNENENQNENNENAKIDINNNKLNLVES